MSLIRRLRQSLRAPRNKAALDQAIAAHEAGRIEQAESGYRAILLDDPRNAAALHLLGLVAHQRGDQDSACCRIREAIAIEPGVALFHFNLGNALAARGDAPQAAAEFEQATQIDPRHAPAWFNLGRARSEPLPGEAAVEAFRRAQELDSGNEIYRDHLGRALVAAGGADPHSRSRCEEAIALLEPGWRQAADPVASGFALAHALESAAREAEAAALFEAVLALQPGLAAAHARLGNCLNRLGRMTEAVRSYREAVRLRPEDAASDSSLVAGLIYDEQCSPDDLFREHRAWGQRHAARYPPHVSEKPADADPDRRLRVGYVSPDLRQHPVGQLFVPVVEHHDAAVIESFCYHTFKGGDALTARIRKAARHWREVASEDDDALAEIIRGDRIDILVDLGGHTTHGRLLMFARRPAPVQASWLGYFHSTGVAAMDWFITDPYSSPPGQERWFVERLLRLPSTRFCCEPPVTFPEPGDPPSLREGRVTFGCFNNLAKLNRRVLALWARVLAAVPGSRLVLQAQGLGDPTNRERFLALAAGTGLPPSRIELRSFVAASDAPRGYLEVDIALDPFPFCGGMTSLDALWMGVPIVTLDQPQLAGRQTASMLFNLGLQECVAADEQQFVEAAASLAADPERLAALRAGLRRRMLASPLADAAGFTRALESAFRHMWRDYMETGKP